jgi:hypothetical protein
MPVAARLALPWGKVGRTVHSEPLGFDPNHFKRLGKDTSSCRWNEIILIQMRPLRQFDRFTACFSIQFDHSCCIVINPCFNVVL